MDLVDCFFYSVMDRLHDLFRIQLFSGPAKNDRVAILKATEHDIDAQCPLAWSCFITGGADVVGFGNCPMGISMLEEWDPSL